MTSAFLPKWLGTVQHLPGFGALPSFPYIECPIELRLWCIAVLFRLILALFRRLIPPYSRFLWAVGQGSRTMLPLVRAPVS